MSDKRHCDVCDTTEPGPGQYGWWLQLDTVRNDALGYARTASGDKVGGGIHRLAGDFCSVACLLERIAVVSPEQPRITSEVDR